MALRNFFLPCWFDFFSPQLLVLFDVPVLNFSIKKKNLYKRKELVLNWLLS
jgi:hypothetical protein